ncbi:chemotaxis protein CheC [Peribacillus kribbensis]|uniref:chemotaxis protein CheC n=1 Tax=Peribacillus kribbensis TaxID=356658 RepID=UPI0003FDAA8D|nr:chemotaxis protein CheC [Peribacillus kribbensis]
MEFYDRITAFHLDILREIGNIGAGNAATALSKLLNKKIDMKVPDVSLVSFDEMMDMAGGAENVVVSIFFRLEGEVPGSMFFLLPLEQADRFIYQLTGEEGAAPVRYSEIAESALRELGNIMAGSYLSALSDFTSLCLYPSVPYMSIDMAGAVISPGLIETSQVSDFAIVINTELVEDEMTPGTRINGCFFLVPDPGSFQAIFHSLGVYQSE